MTAIGPNRLAKWRAQKLNPNPTIDDYIAVIEGPEATLADWIEYIAEEHPDKDEEWVATTAAQISREFADVAMYQRILDSLPIPPPNDHPNYAELRAAWSGRLHEAMRAEIARMKSRATLNGRVRFTPLHTFLFEEEESQEWLVPDIIPLDTLIQFLGKLESFKSMAMLGLHVAASYGTQWLGRDVPPMPSYYVSGEKRRRSIRDRLQHLTDAEKYLQQEDLTVIHRSGLAVDPTNEVWLRLVDDIAQRKQRTLVSLDTVTTLAPTGFNENSGESWAIVLSAMRMLTDLPEPATVLASFHPSKEDKGGIGTQSRGHTSFGGEADGAIVFHRPSRTIDSGVIHCRPKDGEYTAIPFDFDRDTMHLVPKNLTRLPLSNDTLVTIVATHGPCDFETIWNAFGYDADGSHRFGEPKVREVLKAAIDAGVIDTERGNANQKTQYFIPQEVED